METSQCCWKEEKTKLDNGVTGMWDPPNGRVVSLSEEQILFPEDKNVTMKSNYGPI